MTRDHSTSTTTDTVAATAAGALQSDACCPYSSSILAGTATPAQQYLNRHMAVDLQALPAAHLGVGYSMRESARVSDTACYNAYSLNFSPIFNSEASHGNSTGSSANSSSTLHMVSSNSSGSTPAGMLTAVVESGSPQEQYNRMPGQQGLYAPGSTCGAGSTMSVYPVSGSTLPGTSLPRQYSLQYNQDTLDAAAVSNNSNSQTAHASPSTPVIADATAALDTAAAEGGDGSSSNELPLLARELGVSVESLVRLFKADAEADYDQPVWMVVNLQGKIKGSYTSDKMLEFCRRGTLSAAQMVLGIDKNLPYVARQELAYYRQLGQLIVAVHAGATYTPLTEAAVDAIAAQHLTPAHWSPLVNTGQNQSLTKSTEQSDLASDLCGLSLDDDSACGQVTAATNGKASTHSGGVDGRGEAAAAAVRLRSALQRLCGIGTQGGGRGGVGGGKQPLWLYINHLGWCRGPFSGGKVMHAHLCGRLPRNTLVVAYDPDLPACMISGDVSQWFRPLGALLDNVANGWTYTTVKWADVVNRGPNMAARACWEPLVWQGPGQPAPLVSVDQLAPPPPEATGAISSSNTGNGSNACGSGGGGSSTAVCAWPGDVAAARLEAAQVGQAVQFDTAGTVHGVPGLQWQQQQQQQQLQAALGQGSGYTAVALAPFSSVAASNMAHMNDAYHLINKSNHPMVAMQHQQQPMTLFPAAVSLPSWDSGSSNIPGASFSSSCATVAHVGHTALNRYNSSGTTSPNLGPLGTSPDHGGTYGNAGAVQYNVAAAGMPAWWQQHQHQQQQQQFVSNVPNTPVLSSAAAAASDLAPVMMSSVGYVNPMIMQNPTAYIQAQSGSYLGQTLHASSPLLITPGQQQQQQHLHGNSPVSSLPYNAAAASTGLLMLLQQQQQQYNMPAPQQQQQNYLLLDAVSRSSSLATAAAAANGLYNCWPSHQQHQHHQG